MFKRLALPILFALAFAPGALASGGNYVFDGGTRSQQVQVTSALDASTFNWSLVSQAVVIHISRGVSSHATPGAIWLDAGLLDSGRFSWGVVQHEYAHQVDFGLLSDPMRAQLQPLLQDSAWWGSIDQHAQLGCERFADLLAWAYWQSPDNVMQPSSTTDEGGQIPPAAFRAALRALIQSTAPPQKG